MEPIAEADQEEVFSNQERVESNDGIQMNNMLNEIDSMLEESKRNAYVYPGSQAPSL